MTITEMLGQSGLLTLLGMCVVFSFIIILICCMKLLQLYVHAFKLDKIEATTTSSSNGTSAVAVTQTGVVQGNDLAVVVAIAAAIHDKELN